MTIRDIALLAGTLFFTNLSAQVGVGGKVGANYAVGSQKIQPDPKNPPTNPKGLGMQFGAFLSIPFSDMVGIRPELGFSFRKMNTESSVNESYNNAQVVFETPQGQQQGTFTGNQETRTQVDQRLSYFQVVAPITLTPSEGLRVMLGPSFNFLMGGKQNTDVTITTKGTATVGGQSQNIDEEDFQSSKKKGSGAIKDFRKADIGALAGIGYTLPVGLDLDLRYTRSLSTTYDETQGKSRYRIWTNLIEFSVGWQFGGK
ncbi:MAG TPA: porin family protein [Flavobacteriales bacterium]|nr:porin family protein [Flavobacteriales bacterium]